MLFNITYPKLFAWKLLYQVVQATRRPAIRKNGAVVFQKRLSFVMPSSLSPVGSEKPTQLSKILWFVSFGNFMSGTISLHYPTFSCSGHVMSQEPSVWALDMSSDQIRIGLILIDLKLMFVHGKIIVFWWCYKGSKLFLFQSLGACRSPLSSEPAELNLYMHY